MKKLLTLSIIAVTLSVLACQDSKDEAKYDRQTLAAYKQIGHQISNETGMRWIDKYNEKNNGARLPLSAYGASANSLAKLRSLEGLVGIAFHHAIDDQGAHHFILSAVGEDLQVWSDAEGKVFIDANTDAEIAVSEASEWTARYKEANPNEIWFHFFGSNVFEEISEIPYLDDVNIVPALNDLDLSPQLLLIILNNPLGILSRTADAGIVYDASSPCPPCPVN
ncbi:hypothetical protein [Pseudochryseolinea flava]|uniref:Uncharacterized protein n=1 Tax=Pseudochryseolinea flava TaxID=2059302 RepID=A0A364Y7Q7_9BACT|nr:hypothetical protein [Pseudochryseolinea flava]RAW02933.1 hypothetical protein DQQ10_02170 [Pseudochryseolinea flava]